MATASAQPTRLLDSRPSVQHLLRRPFQASKRCHSCRAVHVKAQAEAQTSDRRAVLLAGAALLGAPLLPQAANAGEIAVNNLSGFQKADQRAAFQLRVTDELKKVLDKNDARAAVRTVLNDAGTYDVTTGTGGFNGSIRFELERPENRSLRPYYQKLETAKAAIDAKSEKSGIAPISYADLEVMGLKVATRLSWNAIKVERSSVASGGETIATAFGAAWDVALGRKDADAADPEGRIPSADASTAELKAYFTKLGNKKPEGGFGAGKPPFWERVAYVLYDASAEDGAKADAALAADPDFAGWKTKYDRSRRTVTRTDYEVDFIDFSGRLTNLGAEFVKNAYLIPMASSFSLDKL